MEQELEQKQDLFRGGAAGEPFEPSSVLSGDINAAGGDPGGLPLMLGDALRGRCFSTLLQPDYHYCGG